MDKDGLSNLEFANKIKTQTFKQFQLERLVNAGKVIPASKLAEVKVHELQRAREFEDAAKEEQRQRKNISRQRPRDLDKPLTRERFDD